MNLLLDTSILIDFLRHHQGKENSIFFKLHKEQLFTSIITHTELYCGRSVWETNRARREMESLFSDISILSLNETISAQAGFIKVYQRNIDLIDGIIAATAIHYNMELVTLNVKDFSQIKGLKLHQPLK